MRVGWIDKAVAEAPQPLRQVVVKIINGTGKTLISATIEWAFEGKIQCKEPMSICCAGQLLNDKPMLDEEKMLLEANWFRWTILIVFSFLLLLLLLCAKKVATSRLKIFISSEGNSRRAAGPWRTCRRCGSWSRAWRFCAPSRRSHRQTPTAPESTLGWTYRRRWNPARPSPSWGGGELKEEVTAD